MTRQYKLKRNGNNLTDKIEVLREVTTDLLDEIKSLGSVRKISLENGIDFEAEVKTFEILLIVSALEQTGGCQFLAARLLNLKPSTLSAKIKRYDIKLGRRTFSHDFTFLAGDAEAETR